MSNEVANRQQGSAVAALQNLKSGLANVQATLPQYATDPYLRMAKDGTWVYGSENIEVEPGSRWAVNPLSIKHGFSCWTDYPQKLKKKNELLGERMVGMTFPKPDPMSLPQYTNDVDGGHWEWKDQVSFMLVCISGEDVGEQVLYKTTSVGGTNAVNTLIDAIMKQVDKDPTRVVPVLELLHDTYDNKTWGKTYIPVLAIRDWVPLTDDLPTDVAGSEEAEGTKADGAKAEETETETKPTEAEKPAPQTRRRGATVPETGKATEPEKAAETPAEEQPRRRRRVS